MVTFVRSGFLNGLMDAREALQRSRMQEKSIGNVANPPETMLGVFEGDTPDNPVHFVAL